MTATALPTVSTAMPVTMAAPSVKSPSLNKLNKTVEKIINSEVPDEYIDQAGINLLDIYKELGNIALNAVVVVRDSDGDPMELGADNRARTTAITLILELKKHIKDKSMIQQVALFDSTAIEDAKRVLALRKKEDYDAR